MKASGICPKCGHRDHYVVVHERGGSARVDAARRALRRLGPVQGLAASELTSALRLLDAVGDRLADRAHEIYVCAGCGYEERYTIDAAQLERLAAVEGSHVRKVRGRSGPYR